VISKSEQVKHRKETIITILHYFKIKHFKTSYNHTDKEVLKMRIANLNPQDSYLIKYWVEKLPWTASCVLHISKDKTIYLNIEILI